ncbi:MAG: hypothetical protein A3D87_07440 [Omnitrophica WOR_2 bacterium RIFCSPHIGHO2_02_FULL_50_17]|nr:MAG: hypothetical protein A3D87_07440 [Omnitrophica WOR_2 bacterium RIFCSPHIGHO2_02_FULL_50_17]
MRVAEFSIKNSLFVNLVSIFVVIAGLAAMFNLRRDTFPEVSFDVVTVTTAFSGASAEDVEKLINIPLEKELKGISGIKEMTSSAEEGLSVIGLEIEPGVKDKKRVIRDIEDAVERVTDLPSDIEDDPAVVEMRTKERPVLEISIAGNVDESRRRHYAEILEDRLLDVPGVAQIRRYGWRDREFWVEVDPAKLQEYHVSIVEVMQALQEHNVTVPAGQIRTDRVEYNVRVNAEVTQAEEIAEVVIRANDAGNWLKVRDVARVVAAFEDETQIARTNGKRTTAMVVVKSEDGDVISVVDKTHQVIREFEKGLPEGMEVILTNDFSYYVKRRLSTLVNNGMTGFIIVVLILFIFMEPVSAFLTAWGLPFSVFTTFFFMYCFGISINIVSMLGLIIVVGMLVDDAVIISENVYRYLEEGLDLKEAVIRGTQEVVVPVTGTIITTCAAFMPLLFMQDIIGKFIREIPLVVTIALLSSLIEAFFILPSHLYNFLSFKFKKWPQAAFTHRKNTKAQHRFRVFQRHYVKFIDWILRHRGKSVVVMLLILAGSVYLWKFHMKTILFTGEGIEQFYIRGEAPKGTPVETMEEMMFPVEKLVAALPRNEAESFRTYVGSVEEGHGFDPSARRAGHLGQITVFLTPIRGRDRSASEIANSLRARFPEVQGLEKLYIHVPKEGPPVGRDIEIGIKGEHPEIMQGIAGQFVDKLKTTQGVSDIETSYQFGKRQLRVIVDENKARQAYLTIHTVAQTVRQAIKGGVATTVKPDKADEEIDVLVRFPQEARKDVDVLKNILVPNTQGNLIPLTSVAKIVEEDGVYVISHLDGKRVIYVQASIDSKVTTAIEVNRMLQKEFEDIERIHPGYTVKYSGEFEEQMKSQKGLLIAFLVAMGFIFIILAAQFDSVIQPFIVMLAIPFGLAGVIYSFFLHGKPISFFALMGVVGLAGVVVNDSIVLVDFINYLRKKGKPLRICLVQAGKMRLRPVFMTSVTTVGGMVSLAYGFGGSDPFLKPLGLSMMWGLAFSTTMVLIIIPCVYSLMDELSVRVLGRPIVRLERVVDAKVV